MDECRFGISTSLVLSVTAVQQGSFRLAHDAKGFFVPAVGVLGVTGTLYPHDTRLQVLLMPPVDSRRRGNPHSTLARLPCWTFAKPARDSSPDVGFGSILLKNPIAGEAR